MRPTALSSAAAIRDQGAVPEVGGRGPLGSVVVPAHQEAGRIAACLAALAQDWAPGEFDVVVVSNGSTDGTASRARDAARALGMEIRVEDLAEAGKAAALRRGEEMTDPPRLYLDADTVCPTATARALLRALSPTVDVAVPARLLDLSACTRPAAAYHRAWQGLPWVAEQLSGRGAYALSAPAAAAFARSGDVLADDRLATAMVPRERAVVVPEAVTVTPAKTVADVLAVRRRVYVGNSRLSDEHGVSPHDVPAARRVRLLLPALARPMGWPGLALWVAVTAWTKFLARRGGTVAWRRGSGGGGIPRAEDASLDVVVVSHRSARSLDACLESLDLAAAVCDVPVGVVVVDNASDDGTLRRLAATTAPHTLVARSVNDGFGRGCAVGVAVGSGPLVLLCNPDVVVDLGSLAALVAYAARHPEAAVVGGRQVQPDGSDGPRSWWRRPTWWSTACFALGLSSVFPRHRLFDPEEGGRWDGSSRAVDAVSGGFLLVRREDWELLKGFDADMLLYGEDVDLCLRAIARGLAVHVCGDATYRHDVGGSTRGDAPDGAFRMQLVLRGRAAVLRRHLGGPAVRLLVLGVGLRSRLASRGGPSTRPRPTAGRPAWAAGWASRRSWSEGWRPGTRLEDVLDEARSYAAPDHPSR